MVGQVNLHTLKPADMVRLVQLIDKASRRADVVRCRILTPSNQAEATG